MDVKLSGATASDVERAAVATVLGPEPPQAGRVVRAGRAQREQRHLLLPALHALQDSVGWVSRGAVDHLAERLGEAPPELAAADIPPPQAGKPGLRLLRRAAGEVITTVDDYEAAGGLAALRRALEQGPDWVLAEVKAAALVGRGGAAFPTARKWEA